MPENHQKNIKKCNFQRLREKLNKVLGDGASLEAVKQKINDWRAAGKVTVADAMLLVKRWKTRETRRIGRQDQKITYGKMRKNEKNGPKFTEKMEKSGKIAKKR